MFPGDVLELALILRERWETGSPGRSEGLSLAVLSDVRQALAGFIGSEESLAEAVTRLRQFQRDEILRLQEKLETQRRELHSTRDAHADAKRAVGVWAKAVRELASIAERAIRIAGIADQSPAVDANLQEILNLIGELRALDNDAAERACQAVCGEGQPEKPQ